MGELQLKNYLVSVCKTRDGELKFESHFVMAGTPTEAQGLVVVTVLSTGWNVYSAIATLESSTETGLSLMLKSNVVLDVMAELANLAKAKGLEEQVGPIVSRLKEVL